LKDWDYKGGVYWGCGWVIFLKKTPNKLVFFSSLKYARNQRRLYIYISTKGRIDKYREWRVWRTTISVLQKPQLYFIESYMPLNNVIRR